MLLQLIFLIDTKSRKNDSLPAACLDISMFILAYGALNELCSFFVGCEDDKCVCHVGAAICFFSSDGGFCCLLQCPAYVKQVQICGFDRQSDSGCQSETG